MSRKNINYEKLNTGKSSHYASLQKKSDLKSHWPFADKMSFKKVSKNISFPSNHKTDTFISI